MHPSCISAGLRFEKKRESMICRNCSAIMALQQSLVRIILQCFRNGQNFRRVKSCKTSHLGPQGNPGVEGLFLDPALGCLGDDKLFQNGVQLQASVESFLSAASQRLGSSLEISCSLQLAACWMHMSGPLHLGM